MNKPTPKIYRQPIGQHTTELSLIVGILPFGLIQKHNGMLNQKANMVEIKLTPTQPSNAA